MNNKYTWNTKIPNWLRWFLMIPAGILAGTLVYLIVMLLIIITSWFNMGTTPDSLVFRLLREVLFYYFIIFFPVKIAPKKETQKSITCKKNIFSPKKI